VVWGGIFEGVEEALKGLTCNTFGSVIIEPAWDRGVGALEGRLPCGLYKDGVF